MNIKKRELALQDKYQILFVNRHKYDLTYRTLMLIVCAYLMVIAPSIHAKSTYIGTWNSLYPTSNSASNASCALCHLSIVGVGLNDYGSDQTNSIAGTIANRIVDVEGIDSDTDLTLSINISEINANTQPGWTVSAAPGVTGDLDPLGKLNEVAKRAEISKYLLQAKYGANYIPPTATGTFYTDVQPGDFNADWIEKLAVDGITDGCSTTLFCPEMDVTKDQLSMILLKAKYGFMHEPSAASGLIFDDISIGSFAASWIEELSLEGITEGCDSNNFCPEDTVTLEGFSQMLKKTFP